MFGNLWSTGGSRRRRSTRGARWCCATKRIRCSAQCQRLRGCRRTTCSLREALGAGPTCRHCSDVSRHAQHRPSGGEGAFSGSCESLAFSAGVGGDTFGNVLSAPLLLVSHVTLGDECVCRGGHAAHTHESNEGNGPTGRVPVAMNMQMRGVVIPLVLRRSREFHFGQVRAIGSDATLRWGLWGVGTSAGCPGRRPDGRARGAAHAVRPALSAVPAECTVKPIHIRFRGPPSQC
mmetsp:Transcript_39740/g.99016  ORF Transcript_39740/g.99016 Transcript_39740/m.99016 type:complete len:234 (+) Transcript_39740:858-1559(+)